MKMSGRVMSCCVALLLVLLSSMSAAHKILNSINDLKEINFGQSVPKHSLILLYWFANAVDIDSNNVIWLDFDPNSRDYGSHHYGNHEWLLGRPPWGSKYYTIGSLNQGTSLRLPSYVVNPPREYHGGNSDRIIIRVQEQNTGWRARQRIDQVFITQHNGTSVYDTDHTYQITTNLLRQIRQFSVGEDQLWNLRNRFGSNANDSQLRHMRNTWGNVACLGLLLFIVIQERSFKQQSYSYRPQAQQTHWGGSGVSWNRNSGMHNYSEPFNSDSEGLLCCFFVFAFICFVLYAMVASL